MDAEIRIAAGEEDRARAYRLRYELYVEDQGLFNDEADHERRWLTDHYDPDSHLFVAEIDGEVVGTTRMTLGADISFSDETRETYDLARFSGVVDERDMLVGTRLLVRSQYRGGLLAFQLLWRGFEFAAERGVELIVCNCEPHLVGRYEKLGFRSYGRLYDHPTNGILVPLAVVAGDFTYLRKIGSPMLSPLSRRTKALDIVEDIVPLIVCDMPVVSQKLKEADDYLTAVTHWLDDADEGIGGVLSDLSRDEAFVLLAKSHILRCEKGQALIRQEHVSRTLYILLSGSLEVYDDGEMVAQVTDRGSIIGEVAFFSGRRRMSDVVAGTEGARVLALSDGTLRELIASHGPVAAKFLQYVASGLCDKLMDRARQSRGSKP